MIGLFCLNTYFLTSQISFTNAPKDKQLFGRDSQTNYGTIQISGQVNAGDNYNLQYSSWAPGEPNNNPDPENAAVDPLQPINYEEFRKLYPEMQNIYKKFWS